MPSLKPCPVGGMPCFLSSLLRQASTLHPTKAPRRQCSSFCGLEGNLADHPGLFRDGIFNIHQGSDTHQVLPYSDANKAPLPDNLRTPPPRAASPSPSASRISFTIANLPYSCSINPQVYPCPEDPDVPLVDTRLRPEQVGALTPVSTSSER
jgi:hypothetical protein